MLFKAGRLPRFGTIVACAVLASLLFAPPAGAYSVLSHEEVVDMAWTGQIVPMLKQRFPGITDDDLRHAHAYAYGGSVIQDIGYYPFGSQYFSDLLHYVRPQEFVNALIRDSTTPDEYAFALGALAHYCGDTIGHPAINLVTAEENPPLEHRFGRIVTYGEDPTAHIRTEFGFDVVEVAQGHYSQDNYRDFIGFQVAKPLMDRAFQETYGIPVSAVMAHEDLAISTYRRAVSSIIPRMTRVAFVSYKQQIQQAAPGMAKREFIYRLDRTEFKREFGTDYYHVGFLGHVAAFFLSIIPKVGPFKALKVTIPNPHEQDIYLKSFNATVDHYRAYLAEIHAAPAPLPPPDPLKVDQTSTIANAAANRTEAQVAVAQQAGPPTATGARVSPPTTPDLPELDLDTGNPSSVGEYALADTTYARLLDELVKPGRAAPQSVDPALAADIERFFASPVQPTAPPPSHRDAEKAVGQADKVKSDLAALKALEPAAPAAMPQK